MTAERIKTEREAKGLSMEHMAAQLGISPGAYEALEKGENTPNIEQLLKLANVFELNPAELLSEMSGMNVIYNNSGEISGDGGNQNVNDPSILEVSFQAMEKQQHKLNENVAKAIEEMRVHQQQMMELMKALIEKK